MTEKKGTITTEILTCICAKMKLNIKADVVSGNQKDFVLIQKLEKVFAKIHVVHAKVSLISLVSLVYLVSLVSVVSLVSSVTGKCPNTPLNEICG